MLYHICENSLWAHWPGSQQPMPPIIYKSLTWFTLVWEIGFIPFLLMPITRKPILYLAASFHMVTYFHLEVGMFAWYSLCFYLPLLPWEKLAGRGTEARPAANTSTTDHL
jgi:hypothetical protein